MIIHQNVPQRQVKRNQIFNTKDKLHMTEDRKIRRKLQDSVKTKKKKKKKKKPPLESFQDRRYETFFASFV